MKKKIAKMDHRYKLWGVILFSTVVRLIKIGSRPIWYDEAFSLLYSQLDYEALLRGTVGVVEGQVAENHPLGFYLALGKWMDVFGNTIWVARLLSLLFGIFTIYLVLQLFKIFADSEKIWVIGVLAAISPFHVHYSQEIRMYSMMAFFLVAATLSLFYGIERKGWYWWLIFAVSSAAAQYTQQLSGIYLLCLAFIPVIKRDKKAIIYTLISGFGAVLLYLPWLVYLPGQLATTEVYWIKKPLLSRFLTLILAYVTGLPVHGVWLWIGFGVSMMLIVFAVIAAVRIVRDDDMNASGMWFGYLAFAPPILLWVISQFRPVYIERALLTSAVMFAAWIGWLISHRKTPNFEKGLLAVLFIIGSVIGISFHITYDGFSYAQYEEIGNAIENRRLENEVIIHSNKLTFLPMFYYFSNDIPQQFMEDVEGSATDTLHPVTQDVLGIEESNLVSTVNGVEGVWFIIFQRAIDEAKDMGFENHPHLDWLDQRFELAGEELWGDLWVMHYQKRGR